MTRMADVMTGAEATIATPQPPAEAAQMMDELEVGSLSVCEGQEPEGP